MITINLLPEEYRKKARTPIKLMLAISTVVAINSGLIAYWSWLSFGIAAEVETARSVLQLEMDGLTPQVKYHDSLDAETKIYASREQTLSAITKNRVLWTKKVDELIDIVNIGGDGVSHYVWFDDLIVDQRQGVGLAGGFGTLKASGHSGSDKWDQVANFLEDVADTDLTPFINDFHTPAWPEGQQSVKDEELVPSEVWGFPLSMELRAPDERVLAGIATEEAQ